ncbi:hypothetical protein H8S95_17035 [Pontibacter sp. KCTC 32443]|uniref:hypothetical protein n=1 Tax=Pontibacter TaxID=323449 RepID=UPI00164DB3A8|nr:MULTISPECIES: hypothetical protein [Pontibacter]MBC5775782.1 hypothetical protein [Pontibacter sp. KCTC 32443]
MAKYLLTLIAALAVIATASAQKISLVTNYKPAPEKLTHAFVDSGGTKSMTPVATPALVIAEPERNEVEEAAKLRIQARQDAKSYYKPKGVFWGTMGTTILYPAAGLVTGAVVSVVPPSTDNADNPNAYLMKETAYEEAYRKQAHRKRFGSAAAGFGIGVAVLGIASKLLVGGL